MSAKILCVVFAVVFAVCECGRGGPTVDLSQIGVWGTAEGKGAILDNILQLQGSSLGQLQGIVESAEGDLAEAVKGINEELKAEVLRIDGDQVRVNARALKRLLKGALQASLRDKWAPKSAVVDAVEAAVNNEIDVSLDGAVENSAVSVDVAQNAVRSKRAIQKRATDLVSTIVDVVLGVVRDSLGGLIKSLLAPIKQLLNSLVISTSSGNGLIDTVLGVVNVIIKSLLDLIAVVENLLTAPTTTVARRRRATEETAGLLDPVIKPVLQLLGSLLAPVNSLIKGIATSIVTGLAPILGSSLTTPLLNALVAIIDLLIPGGTTTGTTTA